MFVEVVFSTIGDAVSFLDEILNFTLGPHVTVTHPTRTRTILLDFCKLFPFNWFIYVVPFNWFI